MDLLKCNIQRGESLPALDGFVWKALMALCLAGIAVAGYLSYVHFANKVVYCADYSGCEVVALSEYSTLFGIPIALGGVALYAGLAVLLLIESLTSMSWVKRVFFVLALLGFVYSLYLTYLELFVILSLCLWCLSSAVILTLVTLLGGIRLLWMPEPRTGG